MIETPSGVVWVGYREGSLYHGGGPSWRSICLVPRGNQPLFEQLGDSGISGWGDGSSGDAVYGSTEYVTGPFPRFASAERALRWLLHDDAENCCRESVLGEMQSAIDRYKRLHGK